MEIVFMLMTIEAIVNSGEGKGKTLDLASEPAKPRLMTVEEHQRLIELFFGHTFEEIHDLDIKLGVPYNFLHQPDPPLIFYCSGDPTTYMFNGIDKEGNVLTTFFNVVIPGLLFFKQTQVTEKYLRDNKIEVSQIQDGDDIGDTSSAVLYKPCRLSYVIISPNYRTGVIKFPFAHEYKTISRMARCIERRREEFASCYEHYKKGEYDLCFPKTELVDEFVALSPKGFAVSERDSRNKIFFPFSYNGGFTGTMLRAMIDAHKHYDAINMLRRNLSGDRQMDLLRERLEGLLLLNFADLWLSYERVSKKPIILP